MGFFIASFEAIPTVGHVLELYEEGNESLREMAEVFCHNVQYVEDTSVLIEILKTRGLDIGYIDIREVSPVFLKELVLGSDEGIERLNQMWRGLYQNEKQDKEQSR